MLVVTTENIPGYAVRRVIGPVVGVTARSFNPYFEGVKSLNGRLNPRLVAVFAEIRVEAVARMVIEAKEHQANAVIGLRFDHRTISGGWNEVCAYGTAVLADPTPPHLPRRARANSRDWRSSHASMP